MRILFIGSGEFALPALRMLRQPPYDLCAVVTQPDRPAGRGRTRHPTPVKAFAVEHGLTILDPERVNLPPHVEAIRGLRADLAVVVAFGQKIGPDLLSMFPAGIINLHASLLPRWRGAAPINWAIVHGDEETGVTVFRLVEAMDAGPILVQRRTLIKPAETADELHDRLAAIGCDALAAALDLLRANPHEPGIPQDESRVTRAPKLGKADRKLDWSAPARQVEGRINGLSPWPGVHCRFRSAAGRDEPVLLLRALASDDASPPAGPPGCISPRGGVCTGSGEVALLELQPDGGKRMSWDAFVNGRHVRPGDQFLADV